MYARRRDGYDVNGPHATRLQQGERLMAIVDYVPTSDAPEGVRTLFEKLEARGQDVSNFLRTLAHSPGIFEAFLGMNKALGGMELDPKLRELAYIRASEINACGYCLDHHRKAGLQAGLTERQVNETEGPDDDGLYDDLQRLAIEYAEEATRNVVLSDEMVERLKAGLTNRQIVELAVAVAMANFTNRISETLQLDLP
ncbi:Carboxymuconolactone decarboxylase family protein [Aquisphaera giovannonii]|uniref:Carboxymuconolactone decarboxylase family protein n=1 Tax=Aquisphaera giovannonii TaxID=406548 RepID=A0A5B9VZK7_9BACT|nr:carboxymuconolactone decarboxylase family protein [Aquisphaera giovannonii]QEH33411.1 Carboxymuconolactone decarboxylase family protein [Aquisphaera giovannonii]